MATLEELQKRIQKLDDIKQIERLQRIYGYYQDYSEWEKVVDLFSENAESVEECDYCFYKGKDSIRRIYWDMFNGGGTPRQSPPWMQFVVIQIGGIVDISADDIRAEDRWQPWLFETKPYGAYPRQEWLHGYYENKYIKENGKWLFSKLHWNNTFGSPFEDGWLNLPLMGWMPLSDADEPPSAFHPYPDHIQNVPYHFEHPITGE